MCPSTVNRMAIAINDYHQHGLANISRSTFLSVHLLYLRVCHPQNFLGCVEANRMQKGT